MALGSRINLYAKYSVGDTYVQSQILKPPVWQAFVAETNEKDCAYSVSPAAKDQPDTVYKVKSLQDSFDLQNPLCSATTQGCLLGPSSFYPNSTHHSFVLRFQCFEMTIEP